MSQIDDFLSGKAPAEQPTSIDDFLGAEPPKKERTRTAADIAKDAGVVALKGAIGLPQAAVGMADLASMVTPAYAIESLKESIKAGRPTLAKVGQIGKALEDAGYRPEEAQRIADGWFSDAQKEANQEVDQAKGFVDTTMAALRNPSTIAAAVGESVPQMLGGAAVARGTMAAASKVAPWVAGALGEGAMQAGSSLEQSRASSADGLATPKQAGAAVASGLGTAALGAAGGKIAQRFGLSDVDTMLAAGKLSKSPAGFAKAIVGSGISEGVFEELPQSVQEQMWQNYAQGRPLDEGVDKAAAMGLLSGAAMGGAGGGFNAGVLHLGGSGVEDQKAGAPGEAPAGQGPAQAGAAGAVQPASGVPAARGPAAHAQAVGVTNTDEAERALRQPVNLTALDRADELNAEISRIDQRLAEVTPENGYGQTFDAERADLQQQAQAARAERDEIAKTWPTTIKGAPTQFSTEAGVKLDAEYALVDADSLVTSHDENLRQNPLFPAELQPRDRSRQASEMQVSGIVQKLDPARLGLSADAATGAPIIGADGLVESGNARTIALKRVYQANGLKAENYKAWLKQSAAQFGLDPAQVDGLSKPVLVRVRATPVNRAEFARQANQSTIQRMSPSEQAASDAKRLTSLEGLNPDENGEFSTSYDFIRQFMGTLPITEQSDMIESDGRLSTTGYRRIQNAVLAKAYGDSPTLRRMTESLDNNLVNVSKALTRAAPAIAAARDRVQAGALHDADIAPDLVQAVEGLSAIKDKGWTVAQELGQTDLTGPKYSQEAADLLQFLADNVRSPRRIAEFLQRYYEALEAAGDPNQGSLLGDDVAPTRADLLKSARGTTDGQDAAGPAGQDRQEPQDAQGNQGRAQGDEGQRPDAGAGQPGADAGKTEWVMFPPESGTLGIPRASMPQIKGESRPALIAFLKSRGIGHERTEVPADSLKPTQAEFSTKKVRGWLDSDTKGDRSVLTSSDGYVLDGHHQWMGSMSTGGNATVIRFDAPIKELLAVVRSFPGVKQSAGAANDLSMERVQAVSDFKDALADLAAIASKHTRAAMVPENTPDLMPTLVKLFDSAIKLVGTDLKRTTAWVKAQLKADQRFKTFWNKIDPDLYRKAALQAMEKPAAKSGQASLFDDDAQASEAVQSDLFDMAAMLADPAPKVAKINGREYDPARDNFKPPEASTFLSAQVLAQADEFVATYYKGKPEFQMSEADRAAAAWLLAPWVKRAEDVKAEYDQKIIDVAQRTGALGQLLAPVKGVKRASEKMKQDQIDKGADRMDPTDVKDLLRSTIVVKTYAEAKGIAAELGKEFEITRVKDKTAPAMREANGGYADYSLNVRMPNGVIAEIQINVPEMLTIKDAQGHKLYEAARDLPAESRKRAGVYDSMRGVYQAAFDAANSRAEAAQPTKAASDSGAPVAGPLGSMPGKGSNEAPSSDSLNQPPSGKRTKSSDELVTNAQPGGKEAGNFIGVPPGESVPSQTVNGYQTERKPASKTPTVDRSIAVMDAARAGTASLADYKAGFAELEANEDSVKAELGTKTKEELLKAGGPYFYMRFKSETKPEIIKTFYKDLLNEYALGKSYGSSGWVMSSGGFAAHEKRQHEALKALVSAQAEEDLKAFAAEVAARREEVVAKREAKKAAMENPKTLEDFRAVMREHITDGKTRKEAFLMLTPEQRIRYDELEAESTKEARDTRKRERKTEVRAAGQTTGGEIVATKHTRDGYDLFVVKLVDRLSSEDYKTVLSSAKRLGGWYSSFRGNGAIPGFQFKDKANAEAFLKLAGGDTADAQLQAEQRRDAFEDDRSQTAVERLRTMAEKLEEQAGAIEGADRKTNTARRARFASRALAGAAEMKAKAKTMRNLAQSVEDGKAKFLDGIRTKSQVDMLTGMVATAKNSELRAKYESYAEQEKRKGEPPTVETADFAEFPAFTAYRSDLASLARQMLEVEGTKKLGQQLMKIADDVSDAYIKFAKEPGNLAQLSTFSIRRGDEVKTAIFPSNDLAERAIKRSGLTGKAIVLVEKRGVNRIIMSPSEAMNAGIWTGDGDKRITLTADAGNTLVEAIGRRGNKGNGLVVPWQFQTAHDRMKALSRMGIETPAEFRSALREFIGMQERAMSNKVREMELAMAGKKSDGLDFFPTPAEVADQMVEAADIEPGMLVLEPSGGMGHIADRIRLAGAEPDVGEIAEDRRELLEEKGYNVVARDFMAFTAPAERGFTFGDLMRAPDGTVGILRGQGGMGSDRVRLVSDEAESRELGKFNFSELEGVERRGAMSGYDRIVMNPPFSQRRDAEHVMHAYSLLKPGGRIVAIMGEGVFFGKDKKAQDFRDWLDSVGGTDEKLPAGSFMDPSLPVNTGVNARMVVIDKPSATTLSRGETDSQDRITFGDLQALADRIKAGAPNMPRVHVLPDPSKAPRALREYINRQDAWYDVEGAMHDGELYLFASGLADAARAEHVLIEHEAAHYGLRAILGPSLKTAMRLVYIQNASVRRAVTELQKRGKLSDVVATEEVIVDIPSSELAQLKGWRKVVEKARDWLAGRGYTAMAERLGAWLDGTLTQQQRADLFVADLVRAARDHVKGKRPARASVGMGTRLSGTLAEDIAKQEAWLQREAQSRGFKDIEDLLEKDYATFEKLAELWRKKNPAEALLSRRKPANLQAFLDGSKVKGVVYHATRADFNAFDTGKSDLGAHFGTEEQANKIAGGMRLDNAEGTQVMPVWLSIKNPLRLKDVGTFHADGIADQLERKGLLPKGEGKRIIKEIDADWKLRKKYDPMLRQIIQDAGYDGVVYANTQEGKGDSYIAFKPEQIKSAIGNRGTFDPNDPDIRMSRAAPSGGAMKTVADRAEAIIQKKAAGFAPLDRIARLATKVTGAERLTGAIYSRAGALLDRLTPEKVKAGLVSDYGVPEAVIDQRVMLQGRQRVQLRKVGTLIEKLSTLTREESRVAYEWMNMDGADPQAYVSKMQGLPEESVLVLQEVQKLVDDLSQEAVRLGQLDAESFKRNRFAYLRRSYAKHVLEQTAGEKAKRSRVISILGDQYKGRGLVQSEPMAKMQAAAPDWWGRKLASGKADTALKGAQFIRLEKRTLPGQASKALPGMAPAGPGRVQAVVYWPADQAITGEHAGWTKADTWEVRDVKGGQVVLWRDFTKDEREQMGEVDEARFAIAKTMHGMIHDVETGRYLEWLGKNYAKAEGQQIPGVVVEASERMRDSFAPNEWVKVPDTKIPGTAVLKYGKLAGKYLPGPIWNDLRQVVAGGQFKPFGETYAKILRLWKTSKTALSPGVHMNNVMSNFVMADWQDVRAAHVGKALRILLAAGGAKGGISDKAAALEILNRYKDSGGDIGSWATQEIAKEQLDPLLADLEIELAATNGQAVDAQTGVYAALQHALGARFPAAWEALRSGKTGKAAAKAGGALIDLYQAEDDVFRLAAWLKAKEEGADDLGAGKTARRSFLDYHVNAPWIQAMRNSAWPFITFTYRAVPLLAEIAGKKPHKLFKLMMLAGGLNALGVMMGGGGDDDERKLLPEEKAGGVWGIVPKLIRMPWNDAHGSPVYLDIRRWVPVGDVFDVGQGNSAIPMLPGLMPGGPLVLAGEVVLNKSAFTGKPITQETDTGAEKAAKLGDYLYKAFAPNIVGLPGTYATEGVVGSLTGRTDAFGREMSTAQAMATSVGVKLGSYPADVLRRNIGAEAAAQQSELDKNIAQLKRQLATGRIDREEFNQEARKQIDKKAELARKVREKLQ